MTVVVRAYVYFSFPFLFSIFLDIENILSSVLSFPLLLLNSYLPKLEQRKSMYLLAEYFPAKGFLKHKQYMPGLYVC